MSAQYLGSQSLLSSLRAVADDVLATGCVAQPSLRATIVASFPGVFPRRIYIARGALDERTRSGLMLIAYRAITETTSLVARILVALHAWLIVCVNTDVTMGNW